MAATKVGIIYSLAQKKRRVLIVPDDDSELTNPVLTPPGTAMLTLDRALYGQMKFGVPGNNVDDWLAAQIGAASSDRVAVIDGKNQVAHVIHADPTIDSLPGMTLTQSDIAMAGDQVSNSKFMRRYVLCNAQTGLVTSVVTADAANPPAATALSIPLASQTLQIGGVGFAPSPVVSGLTP